MRSDLSSRLDFQAVYGKHLLIALSGGADSVALACLLAENREKFALKLTAAHYNHRIRPREADLDAAFCEKLCEELGIDFILGEGDVPAEAKRLGIGLESAARDMRYRFLFKAMKQANADCVALAHHLNDQAETVLMHLFRGTGPEGISGMEILRGKLYRPLLGISKAQLTDALGQRGIFWREDSTNAVADTPRNALRLNVLPEIEKSYPSASEAIARYAHLARMESDYIARQTEEFAAQRLRALPNGHRILLEGGFEEVLLRRLLRQICGSDLLARKMDEIIALCGEKRGKTEISGEIFAEKTPSALYILRKNVKLPEDVPLRIPGETRFGEGCVILAKTVPPGTLKSGMNEEVLDADALEGARVRTRRAGDRIRPLGCGDKLLSDYLTDRKIDRPLRDYLPLAAKENRVLWACGLGISEDVKIRPETKRAVKLIYITEEKAEV